MKTWLVASVLVIFIQFSELSAIVPSIEPEADEIHLNEGDSLEIKCISDQPVTFHYPESSYKINTTIPEIINKSNSGKFILILKKNETSYGDAGWYGCANSDVQVISNVYEQPDVTWTYVFVQSNRSLFVENQGLYIVNAKVGDRVILSCRPTSTKYQVTLVETRKNDIQYIFDPKLGFIFNEVSFANEGFYNCKAKSADKENIIEIAVEIDPQNLSRIPRIEEKTLRYVVQGQELKVNCSLDFEKPTIHLLKWTTPRNSDRYSIKNYSREPMRNERGFFEMKNELIIKNVSYEDAGDYICTVEYYNEKISSNATIIVHAKPTIAEFRNIKAYYPPDSEVEVECQAFGYPAPNITWNFNGTDSSILDVKDIINFSRATISRIRFIISGAGLLSCEASNIVSTHKMKRNLFVSDFPDGYGILAPNDNVTAGDTIEFTCGASIYDYTDSIKWNDYQGNPILENDRLKITKSTTLFSYQSSITIENVDKSDAITYYCLLESKDHGQVVISHILQVYDEMKPTFVKTNLNDTESIFDTESDSTIVLTCYINGMPKPEIMWSKDNDRINGNGMVYIFKNSYQELHIEHLKEKHSGKYSCEAQNRVGYLKRSQLITVKGKQVSTALVISITIFLFICIVLIVCLSITIYKKKYVRKRFMTAGSAHFQEGTSERSNPDLTVDDQVELQLYVKKWEFPRRKLSFVEELDAGAFGVVMKAEAKGIIANEPVTTVAVKMARRTSDTRALERELEIMVYLGKHLNVVNFLGACTENLANCPLMIILEYCRYGNLRNYLVSHRADFINQIHPITNQIDLTIGDDSIRRNLSMGSNCNLKPICTQDLLTWAFQVARGMEYLCQLKVLHSDLAARNILLAEDNVVKISDFGLAKIMFKNDNYERNADALLPLKWMAIESLKHRVFSTPSDVWSFGIVLWEFFTLAETPYKQLKKEELYLALVKGYRLGKPKFANDKIYDIMLRCWHENPTSRPPFKELVEIIRALLEESVKTHYLHLNSLYSNASIFENGE